MANPGDTGFSHQGGQSLEAAAGGNTALLGILQGFNADIDDIHAKTGLQRGRNATFRRAAPPLAQWTVTFADGKYMITIVNPADAVAKTIQHSRRLLEDVPDRSRQRFLARGAGIFHQIQTSTNTLFDASGDIRIYGPEQKTVWEISHPNETRYLRFRSKYQDSDFNAWQRWNVDPATCGFNPIWAGVVRSLATALANQASTPNGANPLTQSGVTTRINVAASGWYAGDLRINYNSGFTDPGSFGTYYVYTDDPKKAGGVVVFHTTTNIADITGADGRIFFGKITTSGGGGGSGSGGGSGGGCSIGEAQVELYGGKIVRHDEVRRAWLLKGIDGEAEEVQSVEQIPDRPCFLLELENGLLHPGCSSDTLLQRAGGEWEQVFNLIVGDQMASVLGPSKIKRKVFIGNRTVYRIILDRTRTMRTNGFHEHNKAPLV